MLSSCAPRLAVYGVLTALPQAGFAFGAALALRRLWRFVASVDSVPGSGSSVTEVESS